MTDMTCISVNDDTITVICKYCNKPFDLNKNVIIHEDKYFFTTKGSFACTNCGCIPTDHTINKSKDLINEWNDNADTKNEMTISEQKTESQIPQVKCPYCGSTQVQLVRRKWTPVAGILTNKVDRYCLNCKKKF